MKTVLLVIDLQRYYLERGEQEKLKRVGELITKTNELIDLFHETSQPVVLVQNVHKADGSTWNQMMKPHWTGELLEGTVIERTWEAELHPDLHTNDGDVVQTKTRASAFLRTELEEILRERQVDTVVITGYAINRCVGLTAIEAWERDFKVILAGEAILGTTVADGDLMLDYLKKGFGIETVSNATIGELVKGNIGL